LAQGKLREGSPVDVSRMAHIHRDSPRHPRHRPQGPGQVCVRSRCHSLSSSWLPERACRRGCSHSISVLR